MRIIDAGECSVNACAQFEYKGWTVSMSTILNKRRVEVLVFNDLCDMACNTVEDAIKFIDEMEE
jgi:hypothetical protein